MYFNQKTSKFEFLKIVFQEGKIQIYVFLSFCRIQMRKMDPRVNVQKQVIVKR